MELINSIVQNLFGAVQMGVADIFSIGNSGILLAEFLGIKFFDDDVYKLMFRFAINFIAIVVIVRYIYYPSARKKEYMFTYFMISVLIFFICFTLKKFELGLGMALGLFALFGILRYRTGTIPIKEMTYLFMIIGLSVINALVNKKMSYAELAFTNFVIIGVAYVLERAWLLKHEVKKSIVYEKIDLIVPEKREELIADLEKRIGIKISRLEIGKIDFLRDTANIRVYFYEEEQSEHYSDSENNY